MLHKQVKKSGEEGGGAGAEKTAKSKDFQKKSYLTQLNNLHNNCAK